jgi:UPF0755 protein
VLIKLLTPIAVVLLVVGMALLMFLLKPLAIPQQGLRYQLVAGTSLAQLVTDLARQQVLNWPWLFKLCARVVINPRKLRSGEYFIKPGTNAWQLLQQFIKSRGMIYYAFTIVPGWSQEQLYQMLAKAQFLQHRLDFTQNMSQLAQIISYQLTRQNVAIAGWFAADTYYYLKDTTDLEILQRAYWRMQKQLLVAWQQRDPAVPWHNPAEALIAASLVEKEAWQPKEQQIIAGVIVNRLHKKMRLQLDATRWYVTQYWCQSSPASRLPGSDCQATLPNKQQLAVVNAYNTYLYSGLPPQAIAIPSIAAIKAVLQPSRHHYFYFVATGYGGHQFSTTLAQQQLAILALHYRRQGFYSVNCVLSTLARLLAAPVSLSMQLPQLRVNYGC